MERGGVGGGESAEATGGGVAQRVGHMGGSGVDGWLAEAGLSPRLPGLAGGGAPRRWQDTCRTVCRVGRLDMTSLACGRSDAEWSKKPKSGVPPSPRATGHPAGLRTQSVGGAVGATKLGQLSNSPPARPISLV